MKKPPIKRTFNRCPFNNIIKDKADFEKNYHLFAEKVFYKERGEKVYIKIAIPTLSKEVKNNLFKIKD